MTRFDFVYSAIRIAAVVSAVQAPGLSHAQPTPPGGVSGVYTIERETRERWINARQSPLHTPHARTVSWIAVDSLTADSTGRRILLGRASDRVNFGEPVRLTLRPDGHVLALDARARTPPALATARTARDSLRMPLFGLVEGPYLRLPNTRLWDVAPVFRPARIQRGARWIDTLVYAAEVQDHRQSLTGVRVYTLVGDTTVGGRRLWMVRDSAVVHYTDHVSIEERVAGLATIDRRATGVIVGRFLFDPEIGLFRSRADTTDLRGEARLRYADGRTFVSPTRFDRVQRWSLYDRSELETRIAQLRARNDSNSFSIVRVPRNALEERIVARHAPTIDSLFTAWRNSRDADQRIEIKQLLSGWLRDSISRERFARARAAEGDTLHLVADMRYGARLRMSDVDLLLPFMRDPGLAFQHGIPRDIPYVRIVETLVLEPPAIQPDTAKWRCEPAACRRIAAEYATATEPRLKSAALAVLALTEPRRWRDTLRARALAGDNLLELALPLVAGQVLPGYRTLSGEWPPLPPSNADWTAWRDWVRGPVSRLSPAPAGGRGGGSPPPPDWLRSRGNPTVIRFEQAATGRDIVSELHARFSAAPDDTAHVVIGNLLAGLNALPWTIDSIVLEMQNGTPLRRAFAAELLAEGPARFRFEPADDATAEVIQEKYFDAVSNRREPWRTLEDLKANRPARGFRDPPTDAASKLPVYYARDSLIPAVRARWSDRVRLMSQAEWNERPARDGGELWTISRVDRAGPFARVRVTVAGRNTRAASQGPSAWYSWTTYYLMSVDGEWVIVYQSLGVT